MSPDRRELLALIDDFQQGGEELIARAHRIRRCRFGRAVRLCSIVPGKLGGCPGDCSWCAQSAYWTKHPAPPQRTDHSEIVAAAEAASALGAANIGIVNSGLRPSEKDLDEVIRSAEAIRERLSIGVCASLGALWDEQARRLADSAVVRYHHNLETSRKFFPSVVTTHSYDEKLRTLRIAKQAGLRICCGGLLGLGETWEDRIELACTLRDEVQPDVVPLNFLVPIPGTPLENRKPMPPRDILATIAVFRLILPSVDIKVAGGRETNLRNLQSWVFYAGATSCMIGHYLTTAGQDPQNDLNMIKDLDLEIVSALGKTPKAQHNIYYRT